MVAKDEMSKQERITEALILKMAGFSDKDIAEKLDVSRETVNRYLNQDAKEIHKLYSAKAKEELRNNLKEELHARFTYKKRKLLEIIEGNSCSESTKLGALKELTRDTERKCEILSKIGVINEEEQEYDYEDITPEEIQQAREMKEIINEGVEEARKANARGELRN